MPRGRERETRATRSRSDQLDYTELSATPHLTYTTPWCPPSSLCTHTCMHKFVCVFTNIRDEAEFKGYEGREGGSWELGEKREGEGGEGWRI
jgi:hypothetical protein